MTISNLEQELKDKVAEFAATDEVLKETIARLAELESLIIAHKNSRDSLDNSNLALSQVVNSMSPLLVEITSAVAKISKTSSDFAPILERLISKLNSDVKASAENTDRLIQDFEEMTRNLIGNSQEENRALSKRTIIVILLASIANILAVLVK